MTSGQFSREDYIYYARLAEQGERYEDMIRYMKEVSRVSVVTEAIAAKLRFKNTMKSKEAMLLMT